MKVCVFIIATAALLFLSSCNRASYVSGTVTDANSVVVNEKLDQASLELTNIEPLLSSCAACHGSNGVSVNTDWPTLSGQNRDYLLLQLKNFKAGKRVNSVMPAALLADFDDQQLASIADYYSALPQSVQHQDISELNDLPGAHVRARCVSCHGMDGRPVTSLWPSLTGQKTGYLIKQLRDYKSGKRQHPVMEVIAKELSDQQMIDVSEYYNRQK